MIYPRQASALWGEGRRPLPRALDIDFMLLKNYNKVPPQKKIGFISKHILVKKT